MKVLQRRQLYLYVKYRTFVYTTSSSHGNNYHNLAIITISHIVIWKSHFLGASSLTLSVGPRDYVSLSFYANKASNDIHCTFVGTNWSTATTTTAEYTPTSTRCDRWTFKVNTEYQPLEQLNETSNWCHSYPPTKRQIAQWQELHTTKTKTTTTTTTAMTVGRRIVGYSLWRCIQMRSLALGLDHKIFFFFFGSMWRLNIAVMNRMHFFNGNNWTFTEFSTFVWFAPWQREDVSGQVEWMNVCLFLFFFCGPQTIFSQNTLSHTYAYMVGLSTLGISSWWADRFPDWCLNFKPILVPHCCRGYCLLILQSVWLAVRHLVWLFVCR